MNDFELYEVLIVLGIGGVIFWEVQRRLRRRASLRKEGDCYVWVDFDGTEGRSQKHPGERGGAWETDGDGGDGDGGGGGD